MRINLSLNFNSKFTSISQINMQNTGFIYKKEIKYVGKKIFIRFKSKPFYSIYINIKFYPFFDFEK
jgi:hypothetical protein